MYQTQRELRDYAIYNDNDIIGFIEVWNRPGAQKKNSMGQMTSVLKPVADRYNLKNPEESYQFRRQARSLVKWYSYISQVVRMFDREMHHEYLFLRYLIDTIQAEKEEDVDLDGKLGLEYYKLKKTFEGAIQLENMDGQYKTVTDKGKQGLKKKSTFDEILEKVNEKFKGDFTEADRVMLGALHDKLAKGEKLANSARTTDPLIFMQTIFQNAFGTAAMDSYMESQESYQSLFEDKAKYDAIMNALAGVIYREMREPVKK